MMLHSVQSRARPRPRPRKMQLPFSDEIPKHWFAGMPVATHIVNGVNLLFPAGERFFIHSIKPYLHLFADDPDMQAQIRGFFGQEGRHAYEHERFFAILEAQGYQIRPFLDRFERFIRTVLKTRLSPQLQLAITAACEHFTAILADGALDKQLLKDAHPVMRALFLWHAAEEIEHKSVAFDVLQRVNPSYRLRLLGLLCATVALGFWWLQGTRMLLAQEDTHRPWHKRNWLRAAVESHVIINDVFLQGILDYARRDFHPWNHDNSHLVSNYFASIGRAQS